MECGKWGTIEEEAAEATQIGDIPKKKKGSKKAGKSKAAPVVDLSRAAATSFERMSTGLPELDRVLSGGIVSGSVTLIAGEPGIGKSTLLAQMSSLISQGKKKSVLYISGEESESQIAMRFSRLGLKTDQVLFSNTVDIASVVAAAKKEQPAFVIIDSIQTMVAEGIDGMPGTPSSVRAATAQLIGLAKQQNIPIYIVGQVTKDGSVAGPKTLEHLVDTVLALEGDHQHAYRMMRVVKHRFGSTDELGVFEMTENGMIPVANPSERFLEERVDAPGSVICSVMEGNRPFLLEVQALVESTHFPQPIRRATGFDSGRLQMLLAVASKHAGISLGQHDVYVNIVGGMKVRETAADLAVIAAIISSYKEKSMKKDAVYIGEIGLSGELRKVPFLDRRIKEARRLGYKTVFSPKTITSVRDLFSKK
jgi:DNA repair protein RadA/Sms